MSLAYREELLYVGLVPLKLAILPVAATIEQIDFPLN